MPSDAFLHRLASWSALPSLDDQALHRLDQYAALLAEWNQRLNLTAISDAEGIETKHFLDSLSVLTAISAERLRLIDVGSGAGFPGLVLAIVQPTWQVTLLEATRKKVDFLALVAETLALGNVQTLWARAEEAGQMDDHREQYDVAVARAVAELNVLAEFCLPFVRVGGQWIAQKGPRADEELQAARNAFGQLGGKLVSADSVEVPGIEDQARTLVIVEKVRPTPATFPRRPGTPSKRPL